MWELFAALNDLVVRGMDYVLGWILYLPRDVRLFVVAVMTSAILTFVRLFATDQEWLGRAGGDKKRLKRLRKQAAGEKDKQARGRYKQTFTLIQVKSLKFEGKPLLWAIVPIALLATWCFGRLGYHPPEKDQTVELRLYVPKAAIGRYTHLDPVQGVRAENGWVQEVVADSPAEVRGPWDRLNARVTSFLGMTPPLEGVAVWRLKAAGEQRCRLKIRYDGQSYEKQFQAGSRHYAPAVAPGDGEKVFAIELAMKPVKLFGVVGGLDFVFLPPWLVAYLLIAIPFVTVIKRVFRIY